MNRALVCSLVGVALCGCTAAKPAHSTKPATAPVAVIPQSVVAAVYTAQPPPIDGRLSSPQWGACKLLTLGGIAGDPAPLETEARVLLDKENLYVAWRCHEKQTDKLVYHATTEQSDPWQDDSVELFVSPDGADYYHFTVNCAGTLASAKGSVGETEDTSWKSSAAARTLLERGVGWSVTLRVPLKDLSPKSGAGQTWLFNLYRTKPTGEESLPYLESSWSRRAVHNYGDSQGWGKLTGVDVP